METDAFGSQLYYRVEVLEHWDGTENDGSFDNLQRSEQVSFQEYAVLKKTEKGVRLKVGYGAGKYVCHTWRKAFAYPTKAQALTAFKARRSRQVSILTAQLARAQDELRLAEAYTLA